MGGCAWADLAVIDVTNSTWDESERSQLEHGKAIEHTNVNMGLGALVRSVRADLSSNGRLLDGIAAGVVRELRGKGPETPQKRSQRRTPRCHYGIVGVRGG